MSNSIGTITFEKGSFLQRLPRFRGRARVVAAIWRMLPFLKAEASLRVSAAHTFPLDSTYPTHVAIILERSNEPEEVQVVARLLRPGDVFFDIGANWGMFSVVAAHAVERTGRVIAVEGNPLAFKHLLQARNEAHAPQILALNYAISNESGSAAVVQPGVLGMDTGGFLRTASHGVVSITVDDLYRLIGSPQIRLLKMDIEGAEPLALDAASAMLEATEFALIEVSDYTSRFDRSRHDVYTAMRRAGFKCAWFFSGNPRTESDPFPAANVLFGKTTIPGLPAPASLDPA